jgi:5-methylcytosine-specific restriction protein A
MPRLKTLPPLLRREQPRLRMADPEQERDKRRYREQPWRKLYQTKKWFQLRWTVLVRDQFTCQICGCIESDTSKLVGDHIIPHEGDLDLFFSEPNIRCLCKTCHDGVKQREDKARKRRPFTVA